MQARRQQRERIAGVLLAILGVAVLVIAVVALASPDSNDNGGSDAAASNSAPVTTSPRTSSNVTTSAPRTMKATSSSAPGPSLSLGNSTRAEGSSAKKLPLVVLNNTRTNGLATDAADQFRSGGWKVDDVGNISDDIISTCAYYDPDVDGAEKSAKALRTQFDGIDRVLPKFSGLPGGPIVVVLTSGYSSN